MLSLDDRLDIESLLYRAFWLVDHGRAAEVASLFTPDGKWTFGPGTPKPGTLIGAEISQFLVARQAQAHVTTRHVLSNVLVEAESGDRAAARSVLTLYRSETDVLPADPAAVADIEDVVVRTDEGWKIGQRLVTPVFHN